MELVNNIDDIMENDEAQTAQNAATQDEIDVTADGISMTEESIFGTTAKTPGQIAAERYQMRRAYPRDDLSPADVNSVFDAGFEEENRRAAKRAGRA